MTRTSLWILLAATACRGASEHTDKFDPRDETDDTDLLATDTEDPTESDESDVDTEDPTESDSDTDTGEVMPEDADGDGWSVDEDCDDDDPTVNPDAIEVCDGRDNNCDGLVDDDDPAIEGQSTWYADADGDGYGASAYSVESCDPPSGYAAEDGDCDDSDAAYNPGAAEDDCTDPEDYNCDGSVGYADDDGDGYAACEECNDGDRSINPSATELCDGDDNDCDGDTDEDGAADASTFYADGDSDGFGDADSTADACEAPSGYVADNTDCDDDESTVYPGASERCDEVDEDCDDAVDEDATDASTWYADADGDGYGDDDTTTASCDVPSGYTDDNTDCDDGDDSVNPAGTETCDDGDEDCDGSVDEDATDASTYYADSDSDGYGDPDDTTSGCDAVTGYVDDDSDCDDGDGSIYPGAEETCDDVDQDCDDTVDEDATDESTYYIDYDGDGYGSDSYTLTECDLPSGYVDNADDCDDTEALSNPAETEVCDALDNDCDGDTDEDGADDASTWYADSDGDGYGDADVTTASCEQPTDYVDDDSDCDDDSAVSYPGANEIYDELDNDCDGDVDEDLWLGTGADGSLELTSDFDLSTDASGTRTEADGAAYVVTAISGDTLTTDVDADGITAGDEVLIINLHGSDTAYSAVGTYEFAWVSAVKGDSITLAESVDETYGESSNSDLTDQAVLVQRVPQYEDVSIRDGAWLTTSAWDGELGGIIALRATGTVFVEDGSAIVADEMGYAAGATGTSSNCDAYQGESYAGEGDGDGDGACSAYNESYGHWINNYGGGGAHITGGGGNHAGGASDGDSWTGGSATAPYAGDTYGEDELGVMFFGSGGGGVWRGSGDPGPGGDGGGLVYIGADTIELEGATAVTALGGTTSKWASGTWTYGAGGGAGGTVWLIGETVELAADAISAEGGLGQSSYTRAGGDGGYGRIRIDCTTCNGYSQGSSDAETELASAAEPDPGYSDAPE